MIHSLSLSLSMANLEEKQLQKKKRVNIQCKDRNSSKPKRKGQDVHDIYHTFDVRNDDPTGEEQTELTHKAALTFYINSLTFLGIICFMFGSYRQILGFNEAAGGFNIVKIKDKYRKEQETIIPRELCIALMWLASVVCVLFYALTKRASYRICGEKICTKWILWVIVPVCVALSVGFSEHAIPGFSLIIVPLMGVILVVIAGYLVPKLEKSKQKLKLIRAKSQRGPVVRFKEPDSSEFEGDCEAEVPLNENKVEENNETAEPDDINVGWLSGWFGRKTKQSIKQDIEQPENPAESPKIVSISDNITRY